MRNIITSSVALLALLPSLAAGAAGPKVNALTNVDWPKITGSTSPSLTCNSTFYGMPYTNTSTGDFYVCAVSGWVAISGGAVTSVANSDGTLTISPTTGAVVASINLAHANIWTAKQTQPAPLFSDLAGGGTQCVTVDNLGQVAGTGSACGAGGGGSIGGSGTVGFIPKFVTNTTTLGNSLLDYGVTNASQFTFGAGVNVNDGTGAAGLVGIKQGTAVSNGTTTVTLTVPSSVTSYRIQLPGVAPTSGNTYLSCTAADPAVCTWAAGGGGGGGGYTNVTGSASETTVALINTACGSGTYYATTALSIATGGTITCPVQFSRAGLWTIASGQTVTFSKLITETDAPSQLFTGSGSVVLAAGQQAPVEWFGAVAVATGSACGTDYVTQLQKAIDSLSTGNIVLGVGNYCKSTALTISHSSQGIVGVQGGSKQYGYGATNISSPSRIVTTTAGADGIDIAGSSSQFLYSNVLKNFAHARNISPTGTATGISLSYLAGLQMEGVSSSDSLRNFYGKSLPSYPTGYIKWNSASWGYEGVTVSGTCDGFYFDGAGTSFYSLKLNQNVVANNSTCTTSHGFYFSGSNNTDVMGDANETAGVDYGVYGTGGSQDFHWKNSINDLSKTSCIYWTGGGVTATFDGGWCTTTAAGTYGVDIESSVGVTVTGIQFSSGGRTAGIRLNGDRDIVVSHNLINNSGLSSTVGIQINNTINSTVTANSIDVFNSSTGITVSGGSQGVSVISNSIRGQTTVTGIAVTGSSFNAIGGNALYFAGASGVGISYDASSNSNPYAQLNSFDNASTAISDAGTGNQISASGVTTTGSPASGNLAKFSGAATITNGDLSGDATTSGTLAVTLAAQYKKGSCTEVWVGSGTSNALTSGDDAFSNNTCYNDSGVTRTITAVKCRSDNASNTTTVHPTFGSAGTGTTILSGAVTCGNSYAYSSSGTVSNASWTTGTGIDPVMGGTLTGTSIAMIVEYTY